MQYNYTTYHLHTEVSLLDSTTNYKDYIHRAKELNQKAICFTEHGNIYNWVEKKMYCEATQYKLIYDNNIEYFENKDKLDKKVSNMTTDYEIIELNPIKYLHGCEVYLTETFDEKIRDNYHTILISKNESGFKELNTLIDLSTQDSHMYYKPRISFDEFLNISDNIIKISACLQSPLNKLSNDSIYYDKLMMHYDYFEVQPHINSKEQNIFNAKLYEMSKSLNKPLIAGTDTHSINQYKAECRTMLQYSKDIIFDNEDTFDLTYKTYEELVAMFDKQNALPKDVYLKAIDNTNIMAGSIEELKLDLTFKYPKLDGDEEAIFKNRINEMYLDKIKKGIIKKNKRYIDDINEEFRVLKKIGMLSFMQFMSELIVWCHENEIPTCPCRGSVGGSTIAYITDITDVDPIVWNTKFSRFANEDRIEIGDIDEDFSPDDRDKVYEYIINRFGIDKTAYILTTNTLADKSIIDEVVRGFANKYRKDHNLPKKAETPFTVAYAKNIKALYDDNPELARKQYSDIFYYFNGLKGCVVSKGIHPAGIIASPVTLYDNYGTFWDEGKRVMSINMEEVHEVSLVKYDILGLKNIGIIKNTCKLVGIPYPKSHEINWHDNDVWNDMIKSNVGIFQFEGGYAFDLLKNFSPYKINDMSLVNASLRPSGESYRDRLIRKEINHNPSDIIDDLLKDNYGYLVFQEDVTRFLQDICGLSGSEADNVRRAIGRKQLDRLQNALPRIFEGYCNKSDKPREVAEEEANVFLKIIEDASSYMFGYNHSTGYSMIGYLCAMLRYYYPAEFIAAYLNYADNDADINNGTELAKLKGIKINPIKFRYSKGEYFVDKTTKEIYKGISSIKFMNNNIADELYILGEDKYNNFLDLLIDIKNKTSVNVKQLDILIKLDFFEEFGDINYLLYYVKFYDDLYNKSQLAKDKLVELNINEEYVRLFSKSETDTRIEEIDSKAYIKSLGYSESEIEDQLTDCIKYKYVINEITNIKEKVFNGYSTKKVIKKFNPTLEQQNRFAIKTVIGKFSDIDAYGLIQYLINNTYIKRIYLQEKIKYQYDLLGYINFTDEKYDKRYVVVTNMDTTYSPRFNAYCINNGKVVEMKIHKRLDRRNRNIKNSYNDTPVEDCDIIYIKHCICKPKSKKIEDEWVEVEGSEEWWIEDYIKVDLSEDK